MVMENTDSRLHDILVHRSYKLSNRQLSIPSANPKSLDQLVELEINASSSPRSFQILLFLKL